MVSFVIIGLLIVLSAITAMSLRNLVHCALSLTVTFAGLAALYLKLNAQFIGFAQILVYIGAVAILIVFAILLTRGTEDPPASIFSASWSVGVAVAVVVFGVLALAIAGSSAIKSPAPGPAEATVRQLGEQLMSRFVLPLEVVGLLLTAALIGAVIIALPEKTNK